MVWQCYARGRMSYDEKSIQCGWLQKLVKDDMGKKEVSTVMTADRQELKKTCANPPY